MPIDKINELTSLKDEHINEAKKIAAYEITKLIHGEDEAKKQKKLLMLYLMVLAV